MDTGATATVNTRTGNFTQAAYNANGYGQPASTVAPTPYKPSSVLNPPTSSGTGMSAADHERAVFGSTSPNGQSPATTQQALQLQYRNPGINI